MIDDVVFNIRVWKLRDDIKPFYIAERLDYSTIIINPNKYEIIKNVYFENYRLYKKNNDTD